MRQEIIDIYTLDELSEEAQKKAIEAHENIIHIDSEWYQSIIDCYVYELEQIGFENAEILFTGFGSQGDGACFDGTINLEKFLDKKYNHLMPYINEWCFNILTTTHQYSHENTKRVSYYSSHPMFSNERHEIIYRVVHNLLDEIETIRLEWCKKIYAALEKEHEFLRSEKYIREYIKSNEIEFKENGEIY